MLRKTTGIMINFFKKVPLMLQSLKKVYKTGGFSTHVIAMNDYGKSLSGKRVLITGGTSGIGLSIAKKSLSEGAIVLITGRDSERIATVEAEINDSSLKALVWDVAQINEHDDMLFKAIHVVRGVVSIY